MSEEKQNYYNYYHKVLDSAYKILADWKEDMSKLSDRDKHLIDAIIKSSWDYIKNTEQWSKSSRKLTIGIKEKL